MPGWRALRPPVTGSGSASLAVSPFTRLARVHALHAAADALIATALAGSLFFSIPTGEARGRVALYLLLTMAPFAIIAPLIGPYLDRARGGRRAMVIGTAVLRSVVCAFMIGHVDSLLLFPEAFLVLVLSKAYAVAKSALVPTVVAGDAELVEANSKLSLLSGIMGFAGAIPGLIALQVGGPGASVFLAAMVSAAAAVAATRIPATLVADVAADAMEEAELHGRKILLAASAMGLMRGVVGFLTFLLAFDLRGGGDDAPVPLGMAVGHAVREAAGFETTGEGVPAGAPTWHFGVVLGVSVLGSLAGALLAPLVRRSVSEERILFGVLVGSAAGAAAASLQGGLFGAAMIAAAVGVGASAAKLAFDALVQRDAPDANRGRSFATFETRFQIIWVVGAFIPVIVPIPARVGFLVVMVAAGFAAFSFLAGSRGSSAAELASRLPAYGKSGLRKRGFRVG